MVQEDLSPKQERFLTALLTEATVSQAAKVAGISESTAWQWLKKTAVKNEWQERRRQAMDHAVATLQKASGAAAYSLLKLLKSDQEQVVLRAAQVILEMGIKGIELSDLDRRITELETITEIAERSAA